MRNQRKENGVKRNQVNLQTKVKVIKMMKVMKILEEIRRKSRKIYSRT